MSSVTGIRRKSKIGICVKSLRPKVFDDFFDRIKTRKSVRKGIRTILKIAISFEEKLFGCSFCTIDFTLC